ncbi:hypothetical protein TraAM80_02007 [Trypanosoma rangeli]|uniref:Uncharacterized protein n=1 Tax=Trypanosoma rangeli TaxID=5698 RepID=A0A3R7NPX7_TRYRA|nr:uncharacterized protein TraAM80_02007 [Trypanosoma rangeli]RNF09739.1 hypothetical protein TraAM80_02007 [Trypanosoma rangeli]|eukprot:RNF09739.1 hypothetical protein TraAM80_02007 [Trypanosoma rangeli]
MQEVPSGNPYWSGEEEEIEAHDSGCDSSSDESEWGTVTRAFCINGILEERGKKEEGSLEDGEGERQLYLPEPVISFTATQRPELPRLPPESLPPGCHVWVVDEDDVHLLLRENWDDSYSAVCNGRLCGTVVRHSNNVTLVLFYDEHLEMSYSLSLPRVCLSKVPMKVYHHSPGGSNRLFESCFGIGNLDPRAGCFREEAATSKINRQFYESLSVMEVQPPQALPQLAVVQENLNEGAYEAALTLLDNLPSNAVSRVDVLVLRSRTNVFLGRYQEALKDALGAIEEEPRWVRGNLAAARAFSGLCKFEEAARQIKRARLLLPHSHELRRIEELNAFMLNIQVELPSNGLNLYLDAQYAKKLVSFRMFNTNEVVFRGDHVILAMESIFATSSDRCCVCLKPEGKMMRVPVDLEGNSSEKMACYCSVECQQRSSLFFVMELGRHRVAVERARDLISCTLAQTANQVPLDMTYMTTRLFLMICVTHERLASKRRPARRLNDISAASNFSFEESCHSSGSDRTGYLPLKAALQHLGVYPLPTDQLSSSAREKMYVLYNTLTAFFSDSEKQLYPPALFYALYEYVCAFAVAMHVRQPDSIIYYLPKIMGAVRHVEASEANCRVLANETGTGIALVASRNIFPDEALSVPYWKRFNTE